MKRTFTLPGLTAVFIIATAFGIDNNKLPQRKLVISLHHMIGKQELVLGEATTNCLGDTISVHKFKYYLSNFSVIGNDGKTTLLPEQYYLVDEADSLSKTITIEIPDIAVKNISFLLGVDSIKNVSGIQTGALDPLKGMFWTWNSGYVMAKLEGSSPSSRMGGQSFTYHVGGFRTPMQTMRMIDLPVTNNRTSSLHIIADIDQWFKNKSDLRIAETPVCHSPGPLAARIADNYSHMFSIDTTR